MKPKTISLEETEANLQKLAIPTGKSFPEIIQELITNYLTKKPQKLPKSVRIGTSVKSDLSAKA
ncbi:CopG family transcriptional regulator [Anabaena aphanizomenioides LEGE 00250]|uniref:CopG family transcriptional regulator n=1 Tax=Sphaerospermopsis aphanizomenoides LEGE 00250 TaxID=2777972 RepID=A0ABR9V952_9CYAN|nr:CopG family transcriptional regulator [Sphaerospermopsis aphanizomenoides]MBE9234695.1 CopG family transcriptional regulator [Sphaerospermopsis aphanizomenoides LEGE 00250]